MTRTARLGAALFAITFLTGSAAPAEEAIPAAVLRAAEEISGDRLHADVAFLADDLLEGRGTGTRGYDLAAKFVANRMAVLGIEAGGSKGAEAYLQPVPFRCGLLQEAASSMELTSPANAAPSKVKAPSFVLALDYVLHPDLLRTSSEVQAPLVFVGYGVAAPEMQHDDFAGVDVRGKVVVQFRGAPPRFPHNERAYYSNSLTKEQMAATRGAIGVITVLKPSDAARQPWARTVRQSRLPSCKWTDEQGVPSNTQTTFELSAHLAPSGAEAIFTGAPISFSEAAQNAEESRVRSFPLAVGVRARRETTHRQVASPNVVGVLRGSDPALAREAIVVSAHLDHLGISEPVDGDAINNGAYDNASGTAMMLEVARAMTQAGRRPKRTVIFLAVTGEEKGLQGSDYFARHPLPPSLGDLELVGNVNLDMVLLLRPVASVIAFGAEHTSLGPQLEQAARLAGLRVVPDPMPEEVIFVRSDQFSFVKQGVPGIFPVSALDDSPEGRAENGRWIVDHYHSPNDDMTQVFDWESGAAFTRMALLTTWLAADAPTKPSWNAGDFFGEKFGKRK